MPRFHAGLPAIPRGCSLPANRFLPRFGALFFRRMAGHGATNSAHTKRPFFSWLIAARPQPKITVWHHNGWRRARRDVVRDACGVQAQVQSSSPTLRKRGFRRVSWLRALTRPEGM